jgi:hypothetical protein
MDSEPPKTSIKDRLRRLRKRLGIFGWLLIAWKWLWQVVGWIGNLEVIREHLPLLKRVSEKLSAPVLSDLLFVVGIVWLLVVVLFGGILETRFKPWKIIAIATTSLAILTAAALTFPRPGATGMSTDDRQAQMAKSRNQPSTEIKPLDIPDELKSAHKLPELKVPVPKSSESANRTPSEQPIHSQPQQAATSTGRVTSQNSTIAPSANAPGSAAIGVNNGTVVVNPSNSAKEPELPVSEIRATRIVESLEQSHATGTIRVVYFGQNQPDIVDVLIGAFQKAGWQPEKLNIGMMAMSGFRATEPLYILAPDPNGSKAQAVIGALEAANLDAPVHPGLPSIGPMSLGTPDVTIVIRNPQQ